MLDQDGLGKSLVILGKSHVCLGHFKNEVIGTADFMIPDLKGFGVIGNRLVCRLFFSCYLLG